MNKRTEEINCRQREQKEKYLICAANESSNLVYAGMDLYASGWIIEVLSEDVLFKHDELSTFSVPKLIFKDWIAFYASNGEFPDVEYVEQLHERTAAYIAAK